MATAIQLTSQILQPVNCLTRVSPRPGFLDYNTYLGLLARDGHLQNIHASFDPLAPKIPRNSALQLVTADQQEEDKTDFRADQALWSIQDLPEILYLLQSPRNWASCDDLKEPPKKQYKIRGKVLRDIPILPDHISSKFEGWQLQAWQSYDPRIKLDDIKDRMGRVLGSSTIQMRTLRFRNEFPALGWANNLRKFDEDQDKIERAMKRIGLDPKTGTTRGLAWGLTDPADPSSKKIPVSVGKSKDCSIEVATHAHLQPIISLAGQGLTVTPQALPQRHREALRGSSRRFDVPGRKPFASGNNRLYDHERSAGKHHSEDVDFQSDKMGEDAEEERFRTQGSIDAANYSETVFMKRKHEMEHLSLPKRRRLSASADSNLSMLNLGELECLSTGWEDDKRRDTYLNKPPGLPDMAYPRPEEVPRAVNTNEPLIDYFWREAYARHAILPGIHAGVEYYQDQSGTTRVIIHYHGIRLVLKTQEERDNLTPEAHALLSTFHHANTVPRLQQLEYLLNATRAQFGFEDWNGRWGETNPDLLGEYNIRYHTTFYEAATRVIAWERGEKGSSEANADYGQLRHPLGW